MKLVRRGLLASAPVRGARGSTPYTRRGERLVDDDMLNALAAYRKGL